MITTHVLDTAAGRPGRAIAIELERNDGGSWHRIGAGVTDDDGRLRTLTAPGPVSPGIYRLRFHTGAYFAAHQQVGFFPVVEIEFLVDDGGQHYHVPLLLSPFGYSTYRGS
ncbi:MAG: hydroxyisourate hydrolase [Deltaproteobacteria bacterium]|nr:MAG: hydroxyisourate hydrolase [Deltaproteobacteria bacterium]TMQ07070.1 MAG: hydroxyisourate hydrolase [Deltaproteobacteria bacterium]